MCVSERDLRAAQEDAEYYRNQADELRERERERADESRRQAKEDMRRRLPSNRLYHGEVTDFSDAVNCHIAACEQEITSAHPDDDDVMRKTIESCNRTMSESIAEAKRAREIYDRITAETENRIVEALNEAGLTDWARCLQNDDYSPMAI
jgi:hypothetical protein